MRPGFGVLLAEVAIMLRLLPVVVSYDLRGAVVHPLHRLAAGGCTVVTGCLRVGYCVGGSTLMIAVASGATHWCETVRPT